MDKIEKRAKEYGHIGPDENLVNVINKDINKLNKLQITFDQLRDFFQKLELRFRSSKISERQLTPKEKELAKNFNIGQKNYKNVFAKSKTGKEIFPRIIAI